MVHHMLFQARLCFKRLWANRTLVASNFAVNRNMLLQAAFLAETLSAHLANKRILARVAPVVHLESALVEKQLQANVALDRPGLVMQNHVSVQLELS